MMLYKINNHVVHGSGLYVHLPVPDQVIWNVGALVRLLLRKEFCINQQPVFQIINAKRSRLPKTDRTKVSGHLGAAFMRSFDRGSEFVSSDEVIDLEIVHT